MATPVSRSITPVPLLFIDSHSCHKIPEYWMTKRCMSVGPTPAMIHILNELPRDTYIDASRSFPPHSANFRSPSWITAYLRHVAESTAAAPSRSASGDSSRGRRSVLRTFLPATGVEDDVPCCRLVGEDGAIPWCSSTGVKSNSVRLISCPTGTSTTHGSLAQTGASDVTTLATYPTDADPVDVIDSEEGVDARSSVWRRQNSAVLLVTERTLHI